MRKIIIAGGTGFLGKALEQYFLNRGDAVYILTRQPKAPNHIKWDAITKGVWANTLEGANLLINLTGKSVDCRYTDKNKREILHSRIESTKVLNEVIQQLEKPPSVWINAGSATIYDHAEEHLNTETNGIIGNDFSMNVCKQWEAEFFKTSIPQVRKIVIRTSIVLGKDGGAYPKIKQITQFGLGGKQGKGTQKVSWIHIADFCRAVQFLIENDNVSGKVNVTAPQPESNKSLMKLFRKKVNVPFGLSQPAFLLAIGAWLLRTETELLLKSRNVYPEKLLDNGFTFRFPKLSLAVDNL